MATLRHGHLTECGSDGERWIPAHCWAFYSSGSGLGRQSLSVVGASPNNRPPASQTDERHLSRDGESCLAVCSLCVCALRAVFGPATHKPPLPSRHPSTSGRSAGSKLAHRFRQSPNEQRLVDNNNKRERERLPDLLKLLTDRRHCAQLTGRDVGEVESVGMGR